MPGRNDDSAMDDDTNTPDLDILKGLSFAPGWAKEPPKPQTYESFSHDEDRDERGGRGPFRGGRPERRFGSDRPAGARSDRRDDRRGDREDRPARDGDRPPRPFRRDDRPPRPFRREDRPAQAEGEGSRRPFGDRPPRRDGERFERRPPREPPVDIATLPVEVKIIPDQKALSVIVFKVAHAHRAYPVRGLSRLFLDNTGSCNVRLEVKADHPDVMLHQCPVCGLIDTDAEHLAAHMLAEHFDDFFEKVTVEDAEPTGTFPSIAKCGISGRLIGPPNHHSFARRFREIKGEVAPRMSDEDYRRRMEIVHDPEAVAQWKQEARIRTLFRRHAEADAPTAAAPEAHAESAESAEAAAPADAPESHAEVAESAEAAAPAAAPETQAESAEATTPAAATSDAGLRTSDSPAGAETVAPAADEPLLERGAAEEIVRSQIVPKRMLTRKRFVCSVEQAEAIRDPQIAPVFRVVWRREQTTPMTLFHAVRGALRSRKFHLFRAGNASGMEFVLAKVPTPLDITHAVPELVQVMDYVTKHECCTRAELFAALGIPMEGTRTAEQDRLFQQFAWIVERGHLIEYHNGVLALPAEFPKFRNLSPARKAPAAVAPDSAAPESHTDSTDSTATSDSGLQTSDSPEGTNAAEPAVAPESHTDSTDSTDAAAPAAAPESHTDSTDSTDAAAPADAPGE